MVARVCILIMLVSVSLSATADAFLRYKCDASEATLNAEMLGFSPRIDLSDLTVEIRANRLGALAKDDLYLMKGFSRSCVLGGKRYTLRLTYYDETGVGECSADPRIYADLLDGKTYLLKRVEILPGCHVASTLHSIHVEELKGGGRRAIACYVSFLPKKIIACEDLGTSK
jgi:hypothetical protein